MAVLTEIVKVAPRSASAASSGGGSGAAAELIGAMFNRGPVPRALTEFPAPSSFKEASGSFFKTAYVSRLLTEAPGCFLTSECHGASFIAFKEASSSFFKAAPAGAPGNVCKHAPSGALPRPGLVDPGSICKHLDRPSFYKGAQGAGLIYRASILPTLRTSRGRMNCHHISRRCLSTNDDFSFPNHCGLDKSPEELVAAELDAERAVIDDVILATVESSRNLRKVQDRVAEPGLFALLKNEVADKVKDYIAKLVQLFVANVIVGLSLLLINRTDEKEKLMGTYLFKGVNVVLQSFGYSPIVISCPTAPAVAPSPSEHIVVVVGKADAGLYLPAAGTSAGNGRAANSAGNNPAATSAGNDPAATSPGNDTAATSPGNDTAAISPK